MNDFRLSVSTCSIIEIIFFCPGGGIGRRKGLKIPREQSRAGSTPALGK